MAAVPNFDLRSEEEFRDIINMATVTAIKCFSKSNCEVCIKNIRQDLLDLLD